MTQNTNNNLAPDLSVSLGKVKLANPLVSASGTCGYAMELDDFIDLSALGAFFTKSITLEERPGNPPQRTIETAGGMLNAIGLANVGLERFLTEKIPLLEKFSIPVFVNVAGKTIDEYVQVARRLAEIEFISGLELNISCPNVKEGGITFGTEPDNIARLVTAVRQSCKNILLIVKLTPNVTDITVTARAAIEAGANALSMVNTFVGTAINIEKRKHVLANRTGGLSGPAIKPIALYMVQRVYQEVAKPAGIPIIGMGGIACASDALEFIIAGSAAVAMGTGMMIDPACTGEILSGISQYLIRHKFASIKDLTGSLTMG